MKKKKLYVVEGYNIKENKFFIPIPGIFKTKDEAERYCENKTTEDLVFYLEETEIGEYKD